MGIQRKKQYPGLAYRTSEVIGTSSAHQDALDLRTRSEERNNASSKSGPRSRSAEPGVGRLHQKKIMAQSYPPLTSGCGALVPKIEEFPSVVEAAVHKNKNTEYRSQFAWPLNTRDSSSSGKDKTDHSIPSHRPARQHQDIEMPSIAEKPAAPVEKHAQDAKKKQSKTEYKAKYKPFTSYVYVEGQWKKTSRLIKICETQGSKVDSHHPWYSEVFERLQKANAYGCRGHGHPVYGEQLPNIYMQQIEAAPHVRPKKEISEMPMPSIPGETKKSETRKKERHERKVEKKPEETIEKKPEKEKKKPRPKSAEPTKGRKPRSQPRPQTAPPPTRDKSAPTPAHHAYAKKAGTKSKSPEARPKSSSRPSSSKKPKEDASRSMLPPDGRASRTSHHPPPQSCSGKVWLQASAANVHSSPERENFKGKHSDAVRPSTLLPPPPKSPPPPKEEVLKESLPAEMLKEKEAAIELKTISPTPVPLTHVQTPEEVTGVKSPEPENWTVPLDQGQKLQWTESSSAADPLAQQIAASSPKIENVEREIEGDSASKLPSLDEKVSSPAAAPQEPYSTTASSSARMTTADVLDRARSRLDQFWGKNK